MRTDKELAELAIQAHNEKTGGSVRVEDLSVKDWEVTRHIATTLRTAILSDLADGVDLEGLVNRFLAWPLPESVCCDPCTTMQPYHHSRVGTNLLTANEARQMLGHVIAPLLAQVERLRERVEELTFDVNRWTSNCNEVQGYCNKANSDLEATAKERDELKVQVERLASGRGEENRA